MADKTFDIEVNAERANAALEKLRGEFDKLGISTKDTDRLIKGVERQFVGLQKATAGSAAGIKANASQLPRLRYALYDISATLAIVGAGMLALGVAPFAIAIQWERAFADVKRTTDGVGEEVYRLERQFIQLAQTIPVAFKELTRIGQLAGQLNVPREQIAEFTKIIAQFSATTGVSADASATAIARLTQLLPPLEGGYASLASAILKTGVNSIATEQQIIAISTQIAALGNQVGLTADQVIGLASAIASVGIQPELARGTITRVFGNINRAVSAGGVALEDFGAISRMSGSEFAAAWQNDSMTAFLAFLDGIGNKEGPEAEAALRALGISSVRDIPAVLRLAQNTELLRDALGDTASQVGNSEELIRQYGIIAETTAEKLTLLSNNFQAFLNALGQGQGGLGIVIDFLNSMLRVMTEIAENPFVATIVTVGGVLTILAGVLAITIGAMTRFAASGLAVRTALNEMSISTLRANVGLSAMVPLLFGTGTGARVAAAGLRVAGVAMKALTVVGIALIAVEVIKWLTDMAASARGASVDVDLLSESMITGQGAAQAMEKSVEVLGKALPAAFGPVDSFIRGTTQDLTDMATGVDRVTVGMRLLGDEFSAVINTELFSRDSPLSGLYNMLLPARQEIEKLNEAFIATIEAGRADEAYRAFIELRDSVLAAGGSQEAFNKNMYETIMALGEGTVLADSFAASMEGIGGSGDFEAMSQEIKDAISGATELVSLNSSLQDSLFDLGSSLRDGGRDWSEYSEAGRDNIQAVMNVMEQLRAQSPNDAATVANNMNALFQMLIDGGYASANQLIFLQDAITRLGGATGAATVSFSGFDAGLKKVSKSGGSAAKRIRTLLDYARDLAQVWSRAFEIRFGSTLALDNVTTSWRDINEEIDEYRRKMAELIANRNIKEYFLSVAQLYGDDLRADKLMAEIADLNADIADAQAKSSTELKGNSKAAIENRKRITGLVSEYQDYIESLAASGKSQAEIQKAIKQAKADFLAQAQALGYSTTQLQPYIKAFDDMTVAVSKVPRNITVTANANPAIQALNEYEAALNSARANAARGVPAPKVAAPVWPSVASLRKIVDNEVYRMLTRAFERGTISKANFYRSAFGFDPGSGFKTGGYTGNVGVNQSAGVVHGKEYVIPAHGVDQKTKLPRMDYVAGLQRGQSARGGNGSRGYRNGGFVGAGGTDVSALAAAVANALRSTPIYAQTTYVDAASAVARGNRILSGRGVAV